MEHFTQDNTEGYTAQQLDQANQHMEVWMILNGYGEDDVRTGELAPDQYKAECERALKLIEATPRAGYEIRLAGDGNMLGTYESYEEAVAAAVSVWPTALIGHDGDLEDGGERTLIWACDLDAENDDGKNAMAAIRRIASR